MVIHTDTLRSYACLAAAWEHKVVDHAESYVKDGVHTNGLENFWSLLKRTLKGTYIHCAPFHLFTANDQSFEGALNIAKNAQIERQKLSVQRPPLTILPLLSRFDRRDEVSEADKWLERFSRELKPIYDDWLPTKFRPLQIIELTNIPYITRFSFGDLSNLASLLQAKDRLGEAEPMMRRALSIGEKSYGPDHPNS